MSVFSGVVVYGKYHSCDPVKLGIIERHDQLIPYYVMDTLAKYPGIPGLFVACVFSGSLSTLSSGFNALAAITWEDLLKKHFRDITVRYEMNMVKTIAMLYGVLAIVMSFGVGSLGTVMQASMSMSGSMNGPLFALFTMAVLFKFVNAKVDGKFLTGLFSNVCLLLSSGCTDWDNSGHHYLLVAVHGSHSSAQTARVPAHHFRRVHLGHSWPLPEFVHPLVARSQLHRALRQSRVSPVKCVGSVLTFARTRTEASVDSSMCPT